MTNFSFFLFFICFEFSFVGNVRLFKGRSGSRGRLLVIQLFSQRDIRGGEEKSKGVIEFCIVTLFMCRFERSFVKAFHHFTNIAFPGT